MKTTEQNNYEKGIIIPGAYGFIYPKNEKELKKTLEIKKIIEEHEVCTKEFTMEKIEEFTESLKNYDFSDEFIERNEELKKEFEGYAGFNGLDIITELIEGPHSIEEAADWYINAWIINKMKVAEFFAIGARFKKELEEANK